LVRRPLKLLANFLDFNNFRKKLNFKSLYKKFCDSRFFIFFLTALRTTYKKPCSNFSSFFNHSKLKKFKLLVTENFFIFIAASVKKVGHH